MKNIFAVAIVALFTAGCAGLTIGERFFYNATPGQIAAGAPGSVISVESLDLGIAGAQAWRVLYRSIGLSGEPIAVSGMIIAPIDAAPAGTRQVVAWAHPTTGIVRACAPSVLPSLRRDITETIPGIEGMIAHGYVVAATDYPGLGTPGPHPYLIGESEARAVLDSVRAAGEVASAGTEFVVWGHSQGGHAALWTGILAADYAPDLTIRGVAAAAPASELSALHKDDETELAGKLLSSLTLDAWGALYGLDIAAIVEPNALATVEHIGRECIDRPLDEIVDLLEVHKLADGFLTVDMSVTPPWDHITAANTPGRLPRGLPVFIAQGTDDTVVHPPVTYDYARELCRGGSPVRLVRMDTDHTHIAMMAADDAVAWMAARLGGQAPPSSCGSI